jgi:hypothetical protein
MIGKQMIEGAATADIGDSLLDAYTSAMPIWRRSFTDGTQKYGLLFPDMFCLGMRVKRGKLRRPAFDRCLAKGVLHCNVWEGPQLPLAFDIK